MNKLTPADVLAILKSKASTRTLCERYGISKTHMLGIRARKRWKSVQVK